MANDGFVPDKVQPPHPDGFQPDPVQIAHNATAATPLKMHGQPALQAILERSGQIIPAGIHRGLPAAFNALIHGVPQQQYEQDVRSVSGLPPTGHGAELFGNEMALDPATYFGVGKLGEKLVETVGPRLAPAVMGIAKKFGDVEHIGKNDPWWLRAPGAIHDFFTPGGQPVAHAARKLALKHGPEGVIQTQRMESAAAGGQAVGASFAESLKSLAQGVLKGVSPEDQSKIFAAIHHGIDKGRSYTESVIDDDGKTHTFKVNVEPLPKNLADKARALQTLDRSIPYVMGTKSMRAHLRDKLGFVLPEPLQVFDPKNPHGIVGLKDFRQEHVPVPHDLTELEGMQAFRNLKKVGGKRALTDVRNRYFQQRTKEPGEDYFQDPEMVREMFERSFDAAGRQLTGATTRANLLDIFGGGAPSGRLGDVKLLKAQDIKNKIAAGDVPKIGKPGINTANFKRRVPGYVQKAYAAQAPEERTGKNAILEVAKDAMKDAENLGNLGKSTLFVTPFPHQRNIGMLGLLANPLAMPKAVANFARMGAGFASPAGKAKVIGEAMKAGATGMPNVEQRGLTNLLDNAAKRLGPIAGIPAKVASAIYKFSGKALWTWDEASKSALQDFAKKRFGGDSFRAAAYVRKHLVDYGLTSPAQDVARIFAPFSTWRTRMPQAVAMSIAEHPEYAIALDRLTQGAATGAPFYVPWSKKKQQSSNPLAEAGDLTPGNTHKYLRSSLSLTGQILGDEAAKAFGMKELPFPASQIESRVPVVGQAMNLSGKSPYGDTQMEELMYLLAGIHPSTTPKRKHTPPRPRM